MSDVVIKIENLSKRYRYGEAQSSDSLRANITEWFKGLGKSGAPKTARDLSENTDPRFFWALKDINLEVKKGEIVGIIGRNGAGKSTLLKILSRITPPTTGKVTYTGRVASLLEVGTGFHRELTGRENVFLNGSILGMQRADIAKKFEEIVAFAEVEKFIDTPVKFYSSGMYVRLAFAVAAHLDPDILLLDEVLAVGDLSFQRKCMDYLKKLCEQNTTILFVSHNMFAVKALCNRVVLLTEGRKSFDGTAEDGTQQYEKRNQLGASPWAVSQVGSDPTKQPIYVTAIEILDEKGTPKNIFELGERMRVRLHYATNGPVAHPNFCFGTTRSDGVFGCSFSAAIDGLCPPMLNGKGVVEALTPPLKLVAELYSLSVSLWDEKFQTLYVAQDGPSFHIRHELINTHFGTFFERCEWSLRSEDATEKKAV